MKKILLLVALGAALVLFFGLGLDRWLTLEALKASQEQFQALRAGHPVAVAGAYFALYVGVAALSLPGATVMTLAGGALFGFVQGCVLVSFASTAGACLATLVARYLLRDWVRRRFEARLAAVDRGIAQDGAYYLFTLRLIPVFPFFLVNLVMGLTSLPMVTYAWVSQLGMLPAALVYVNAGSQLAAIDSPLDILSPGLLASFALLGLLPLAARKTLAWYAARRGKTGRA